jgi:hypothetical protein
MPVTGQSPSRFFVTNRAVPVRSFTNAGMCHQPSRGRSSIRLRRIYHGSCQSARRCRRLRLELAAAGGVAGGAAWEPPATRSAGVARGERRGVLLATPLLLRPRFPVWIELLARVGRRRCRLVPGESAAACSGAAGRWLRAGIARRSSRSIATSRGCSS